MSTQCAFLVGHDRCRHPAPLQGFTLVEMSVVLVIAGQLVMAITLDHFGWAGFRESPITFSKLAGLLLIIAGIWMIRRG